ncbi:ABC transporter ATP-binding protein/permease [Streptomyces sp. J2-1]|uniref:ABC transporter ATP-binding protein n=1 Tax=Streptomyces corallincola TaxID=2851888 RepID=UPI001C390113|nr:ABC transporter ATP-binding protein [Streptomyces corallincola]MBV2354930.1 ABC transporter ATP-binding protein/permease [Streptomyces corallincola]
MAADGDGSRSGAAGRPSPTFRRTAVRLLGLLAPWRRPVLLVLALGAASAGLTALGPRLLGHATDLVVDGSSGSQADAGVPFGIVGQILGWALLVHAGAAVCALLQARVGLWIIGHLVHDLRARVERKTANLPLSHLDGRPRGETLSRTTHDVDNIAQSLQQTLGQFVGSTLTAVGVVVAMAWTSPLLTLVAFVTVPLSGTVVARLARRAQRHFKAQRAAMGALTAYAEETYSGHALVTVFDRREQAERRFARHNADFHRAGLKAQYVSGLIPVAMAAVGSLTFVAVAVVGGLRVAAGALTIGTVQACVQYARLLGQPLGQSAGTANLVQSAVASAERVFELLDAEEELPDPRRPARPRQPVRGHVTFDRVSFSYDPTRPLIQDLSFTAEPGTTTALVGPTGSGKSTLVDLLLRFHEVHGGRILLDGTDISRMPRGELRGHICTVPQDTWLFTGTVAENIAYGSPREVTPGQVVAAARAACLDRLVRTLPHGYDTLISEHATQLSAGEKQLITIARAFLADAPVLVLDEATSALDARTEALVQEAMRELRAGRTGLVVAHRLATVRDADTVLVMTDGRIVERGRHAELLAAGGAYAGLYEAGFSSSGHSAPERA